MKTTRNTSIDCPENQIVTTNANLPQSTSVCRNCKYISKNTIEKGFPEIKNEPNVDKSLSDVIENLE